MPEVTPLEKMLQNAGAIRDDGTDKFFGLENVREILPMPSNAFFSRSSLGLG